MSRLDLYGDPLPPFALARLGTVRWRHRGMSVDSLAFSRDGRVLFTAFGNVTAIDVATGAVRWSVVETAAHIALLPGPDGDRVASVGLGGQLALYAAETGALLTTRAMPSTSLTAIAVSRDGQTIFLGGFRPYGALLNADGNSRVALHVTDGMYLNSGAFSPDDATLVTTDCHDRVVLWSVADGRQLRVYGKAGEEPNHAVFTPDGRRIVLGTCRGSVVVFDVASGEVVLRWKAHRRSVHRVAVTPDGLRVVTTSEEGTLALWRLEDGARLGGLAGRFGTPTLALSPDGETAASNEGARVSLIDLAGFTERHPPVGHTAPIQSLAVARDDAFVVTVSASNDARWWSLGDGREVAVAPLGLYATALRALPEGDRYAVMPPGDDGTVVIDASARVLATRSETSAVAHQKWWGRAVEATLRGGRLTLTNARGVSHTRKGLPAQLAFTADERFAVFVERSTVTVWDLDAHAPAATAKARAAVGLALASRGGEAAVWSSGAVQRFGVPDGVSRATWKAPAGEIVTCVTYAPDGARFAVVTYKRAYVFDAANGVEVARMEGHAAFATTAAFTADGRRLITAGWDTTGLVWSVDEAIAGHAQPAPVTKAKKRVAV